MFSRHRASSDWNSLLSQTLASSDPVRCCVMGPHPRDNGSNTLLNIRTAEAQLEEETWLDTVADRGRSAISSRETISKVSGPNLMGAQHWGKMWKFCGTTPLVVLLFGSYCYGRLLPAWFRGLRTAPSDWAAHLGQPTGKITNTFAISTVACQLR